jgi:hypothetical protein
MVERSLHLTNNLVMSDQADQTQAGVALAFQEELTQVIEIWNETPVSMLHQQAVQTPALYLASENTLPIGKKKES